MISRLSCSFFPPQCSNASSKLNVLVNKLHDYLAQSTVEDNKHKAASRDVDGIDFICSIYEYCHFVEEEIKVLSASQVWQKDVLQKTQQVKLLHR